MSDGYRIFPLGDSALTVEFGNAISVELNEGSIALSDHFESHPFAGFIETVPAYASTTIFFDIASVRAAFPNALTASDAVRALVERSLAGIENSQVCDSGIVEVSVHFDSDSALDLEYIAECHSLTTKELIELFTSRNY